MKTSLHNTIPSAGHVSLAAGAGARPAVSAAELASLQPHRAAGGEFPAPAPAVQRFAKALAKAAAGSHVLAAPAVQVQQLFSSAADIRALLDEQPKYQSMTRKAFQQALGESFSHLSQPVDPDAIYVTEYTETLQNPEGGQEAWTRVATSTRTLSQVLQECLKTGLEPTYNASRMGFYLTPDALADDQKLSAMQAHTFEDVVREVCRSALPDYRTALKTFWSTKRLSLEHSRTPQEWLTASLGAQRRSEATLRRADDTLTPVGQQLLERSLAGGTEASASPTGQFSISLTGRAGAADIPLAGAFIITEGPGQLPQATLGPVLVLIPGQGLMEFKSGAALQEALRQGSQDRPQLQLLLDSVAVQNRERAAQLFKTRSITPFTYAAIEGSAFAHSANGLLVRQGQDVDSAAQAGGKGVDDAANLSTRLGIGGLLEAREQARQDKVVRDFLATATPEQRTHWSDAIGNYEKRLAMVRDAGLPSVHIYLSPEYYDQEIRTFAREKIPLWIKTDLQIDVDPDQILVHTRRLNVLPQSSRPAMGDARVSISQHKTTLTELAMSNTAPLDSAYLGEIKLTDLTGKPLSSGRTKLLSIDYLKGMLRSLNLGRRYPDVLQKQLLDSPEAKLRLKLYVPLMRAQLSLLASEARIRGAGTGLSEAGFLSIERALEKNVAAPGISGANALQIGGVTLRDILVFRDPIVGKRSDKLVVYAPGAPGGKTFHEFENSAEISRSFINNPQLRNYLLGRVGVDSHGEFERLLKRGVRGSEVATAPIKGDFLAESYWAQGRHIVANADAVSTSTQEIDRHTAMERITLGLGLSAMFLPFAVSMPLSLGLGLASFFKANEAMRRGEDEDALTLMVDGLGQISDGASPSGATGPRMRLSAPQSLTSRLFKRFKVDDTQIAGRTPNNKGIFRTAAGHNVVRVADGPLVRVKSDFKAGDQQLQILKPLSGNQTGVHLNLTPNGEWLPVELLPGGGFSGERLLMESNLLPDEHSARVFLDSFEFPASVRDRSRLDLASEIVNNRGEIPQWALSYRTFPALRPVPPARIPTPEVLAARPAPAPQLTVPTHVSLPGLRPVDLSRVGDLAPMPGVPLAFTGNRQHSAFITVDGSNYKTALRPEVSADGMLEAFLLRSEDAGLGFLDPQSNSGIPYRAVYNFAEKRWVVDSAPVYGDSATRVMARLLPDLSNPGAFVQQVLEKKLFNPSYNWRTSASVSSIVTALQKMEREAAGGLFDPFQLLQPEHLSSGAIISGKAPGIEFKLGVAERNLIAASPNRIALGAASEEVARDALVRMGYEILPGAQYRNGLHGVDITFRKPGLPEVYIMEVKQAPLGLIGLKKASGSNPQQMSKAWVNKVLTAAQKESASPDAASAAIQAADANGKLVKLVAGFGADTFKVVRLPFSYR